MRLVLDTNVLVSALLHPGRTPDLAVRRIFDGGHELLVDPRIRAEYAEVLSRKKFAAIDPARREDLLRDLEQRVRVVIAVPFVDALIDEDDRMFVEVALAGRAEAIVTGNTKHFPRDRGFDVFGPTEFLARTEVPPRR